MYRATPITQRDGSAHANENCTMASGATLIDFDTLGYVTSTGAEMRSRQKDQTGGTDLGDLSVAWASYGQDLHGRSTNTFDEFLQDLKAGRGAVLSVWHATVGGPCLSGSGSYGHAICVAAEQNGTKWLVADPWCSPPKWVWWEEAKLRAGAEEWGRRVYGEAKDAGGNPNPTLEDLFAAMRRLMTRYHPGGMEDPSPAPPDTGGPQPILFSVSDAHPEGAGGEPMLEAETSDELWDIAQGKPFFDSPNGNQIGTMSAAATITAVGSPYAGNAPDFDWRACYVQTAAVDGQLKRKVVYFRRADLANPRPIPPAGCSPEETLAIQKAEYERVKAGAKATHTVSVSLPPPPK